MRIHVKSPLIARFDPSLLIEKFALVRQHVGPVVKSVKASLFQKGLPVCPPAILNGQVLEKNGNIYPIQLLMFEAGKLV